MFVCGVGGRGGWSSGLPAYSAAAAAGAAAHDGVTTSHSKAAASKRLVSWLRLRLVWQLLLLLLEREGLVVVEDEVDEVMEVRVFDARGSVPVPLAGVFERLLQDLLIINA